MTKNQCVAQDHVPTSYTQSSITSALALSKIVFCLSSTWLAGFRDEAIQSILLAWFHPLGVRCQLYLLLSKQLSEQDLVRKMSSEGIIGLTSIVPQSSASEMEIWASHSILRLTCFLLYRGQGSKGPGSSSWKHICCVDESFISYSATMAPGIL